jgi:hypothetical protein
VVKASAETTGGAFTIIEENEPVDTPLHVHRNEDEMFYVVEEEHVFQIGDLAQLKKRSSPGARHQGCGYIQCRIATSDVPTPWL